MTELSPDLAAYLLFSFMMFELLAPQERENFDYLTHAVFIASYFVFFSRFFGMEPGRRIPMERAQSAERFVTDKMRRRTSERIQLRAQ